MVRFAIILGQADEKIAKIGMQRAERASGTAAQIHFAQILDAGNIVAKNVFVPAIDFHSTLVGFRENFFDDVEVAVIRRSRLFESGVAVEFGMRSGVVAAMKIEIVILFAVIGQRTVPDLASGDASAIGESGKENGVHRAFFLQDIENLFGAFIHEGDRADLDADRFGGRSGFCA